MSPSDYFWLGLVVLLLFGLGMGTLIGRAVKQADADAATPPSRPQAGPIPRAGQIDATDYAALYAAHLPVDDWYCRCGSRLPCPVVALHTNPRRPVPRRYNRQPGGDVA